MNIFGTILYPPPPSLLLNAMSAVSLISLANAGVSEARGTSHLSYSKFWNWKEVGSAKGATDGTTAAAAKLSGRTGMCLLYAPAMLAALAAFFVPGVVDAPRGALVTAAIGFHFFKRVFEVLFIHRYSSNVMFDTAIPISVSYLYNTVLIIYSQYVSRNMPEPEIDLTYAGIALFLVGIGGNFYHHYLLARLREKNDKTYKIPKGGLFDLVICPHYLFEIIDLLGVAVMSQTVYPFCFALGSAFYLVGRSFATRRWYVSKFDDFPAGVKALLPYIF